jgi:translation initiation factor IF-2
VTEVKKRLKRSRRRERERGFTLRERKKLKRTQTRRRSSETAARSVKARAVIAGPVQVGKIDLNPKKAAAVAAPVNQPEVPPIVAAKWKHRKQKLDRKASCKRKGSGKKVVDKKEVKAVIERSRLKSQ